MRIEERERKVAVEERTEASNINNLKYDECDIRSMIGSKEDLERKDKKEEKGRKKEKKDVELKKNENNNNKIENSMKKIEIMRRDREHEDVIIIEENKEMREFSLDKEEILLRINNTKKEVANCISYINLKDEKEKLNKMMELEDKLQEQKKEEKEEEEEEEDGEEGDGDKVLRVKASQK